jgi:hypothetical protein
VVGIATPRRIEPSTHVVPGMPRARAG